MTERLHERQWNHERVEPEEWGNGPWQQEPDKIQWVDGATGLDCLMHRNRLGSWCGYVGVAEGHPHFGKEYGGVDVEVHGGLTYSDFCQDTADESRGICRVPVEGRPHRVWWLGFDCAHGGDVTPRMREFGLSGYDETYKDVRYVQREVTGLAEQLHAMSPASPR